MERSNPLFAEDIDDGAIATFLNAVPPGLRRRMLQHLLEMESARVAESLASTPASSSGPPSSTAPPAKSPPVRPPGYPVKYPPPAFAQSAPMTVPVQHTAVPASRAGQRRAAKASAEPQPEPGPQPAQPEPLPEPMSVPVHPPPVQHGLSTASYPKMVTFPRPILHLGPPCNLPCVNPSCHNLCGRRDNVSRPRSHRKHACPSCHRAGW